MLSADFICKQFGTRSGLTEHHACSGSILYFLKNFSKEVNFENIQQMTKNFTVCKELRMLHSHMVGKIRSFLYQAKSIRQQFDIAPNNASGDAGPRSVNR